MNVVLKIAKLLFCSLLLVSHLTIAYASQEKPFIIAISDQDQPNHPFWSIIENAMFDAAKLVDAKFLLLRPLKDKNRDEYNNYLITLDRAISDKPDGLILSAGKEKLVYKAIQIARAANINIISINSGLLSSNRLGLQAHVGANEFDGGLKAGRKIRQQGVKGAVCISTLNKNLSIIERCHGFKAGLNGEVKYYHLKLYIDKSHPIASKSEIKKTIANFLKQHTDVESILTVDLDAFALAYDLFHPLHNKQIKNFITFDLNEHIVSGIIEGKILFAISQQPYLQGFLPVIFLANLYRYGLSPIGFIATGPRIIDKKNIDKIMGSIEIRKRKST